MISSLSALADRKFVMGFLLPVILAAVACLFVFQDVDVIGRTWKAVVDADKFAALTLLVLVIWSLAVLLSVFNIRFYRLLEGYIGPLGTKKRRAAAIAKRKLRNEQLEKLGRCAEREGRQSEAWGKYFKEARRMLSDYPSLSDATTEQVDQLVLPTRFGNVIRAFETYSLDVYGVDSIPAWIRLAAVIPNDFQSGIDNARAEVDFFVNVIFLSVALAVLGGISALQLLLHCVFVHCSSFWHGQFDVALWRRLSLILVSGTVVFLAYEAAIERARAWGDLVRSAFDLYLPDLARKLGYELPRDLATSRQFWGAMNALFLYQTAIDPVRWGTAPDAKA